MTSLYESDTYGWALQQAEALRAAARLKLNTPLALDWENLAEEIEDLGKSRARELSSRYYRLLAHLLKWEFQPDKRTSSWRGTVTEQRIEIDDLLDESPSLKPQREDRLVAPTTRPASGERRDWLWRSRVFRKRTLLPIEQRWTGLLAGPPSDPK
jgi:hypothetical protein